MIVSMCSPVHPTNLPYPSQFTKSLYVMMSAFTPTAMDSANINNTFKGVLENMMTEFATIRREIRKSKAAILQAECRLNLCQKRLRSAVNSLKDDVNIVLTLQCNDETEDYFIANEDSTPKRHDGKLEANNYNATITDIGPQTLTPKRHDVLHLAGDANVDSADMQPQTSPSKRLDVKRNKLNDSGVELSEADADEDDNNIPQRRSKRKRTHAFSDYF